MERCSPSRDGIAEVAASSASRQWLVADVALAAILLPPANVLTDVNPALASTLSGFAVVAMFALPVVIGIAILRYRLCEMDRVISRTIGWAIVATLLAGVLVGGIVVLQAVLAAFTNENTIAVAASTLVAFALFQPLRHAYSARWTAGSDRAGTTGSSRRTPLPSTRSDVDLGLTACLACGDRRPGRSATGAAVWLSTRRRE